MDTGPLFCDFLRIKLYLRLQGSNLFSLHSCAISYSAVVKGEYFMKILRGLIAGVLGIGLLAGAGAASAAPVADMARSAIAAPGTSSTGAVAKVDMVRDHHRDWRRRHHYERRHHHPRWFHRHHRAPRVWKDHHGPRRHYVPRHRHHHWRT
ncbi:MAG: hypothetical protein J0H18_11950 [Rhizobiales bacterium]|nr:hypothetical protein [Hyphomicrobiales bacterium]